MHRLARPRRAASRLPSPLAAASLAGVRPAASTGRLPRASRPRSDDARRSQPRTLPVTFEYVGQTTGSKEVEVRARVTGILEKQLFTGRRPVKAGPVAVHHRSRSRSQAQAAPRRGRGRARAGAARAGRARGGAPEAARREAAVGPEGSRRRGVEAELARADAEGRARRSSREAQLNLGYTQRRGADRRACRAARTKSEGSLVAANDTLLTTISQVDPIWVRFSISENEQLRARARGRRRAARAAEGRRVRRRRCKLADGTTFPRKRQASTSPTRASIRRTGTYEMRAELPTPTARCKPGPVRARDAQRRDAPRTRSPCRSARCSTARRASSSTSPARTRTARTSRCRARSTSATWVEADGANLWIVESGLEAGRPGDRRRHRASCMPGRADHARRRAAPPAPPGAPAAPARTARPRRRAEVLSAEHRPMFSRFFIDRPIFAAVLSIFIVLAGLAAMRVAADRAVPRDRAAGGHRAGDLSRAPRAEVLEQTVAAPLENAINGVENMIYMSSTSTSQRRRADPGHLRDRHRRRPGGAQRQQPRQAGRAAAAAGSAPPGRDGREAARSAFLQVLAFYSPDGTLRRPLHRRTT